MKKKYKLNLSLAFDFEKNLTISARDSDLVEKQVDSNKNRGLMTTLVALGPYVAFAAALIKLYCVFN
ncbi:MULTISPECIES: hypothetical protein [Pectobacterium]|uniref:hypothetical protein n=1 Tax=Pectobacterium TaxID=122277 RepID=UPI000E22334B|nr:MULTISPECIES: hypothetical protein [Pectobacterium]MDY4347972.1 hypothetical protein [Pectobacterium brasiliense]RRN97129.1 hypothetical protein DMB79_009630 [Pectobacterium aquaticum]